jgi:hypothetical protein
LQPVPGSPGRLARWRVLELLERTSTAEARQLLRELAEGSPDNGLAREAKATLARLARSGQ